MNKIITLITLCLFQVVLYAQVGSYKIDGNTFKEQKYSDIDGSPYLYKTWVNGEITDIDGQVHSNLSLNYNGLTGKFEARQGSFNFVELNNLLYKKVVVKNEDQQEIFENFLGRGDIAYYRLLYKGESFNYYMKFSVKIKKDEIPTYGTTGEKSRFDTSEEYYVLQGEKLSKVSRNKKDLAKHFRNESSLKYLKKNKLKIRNNDDLAAFLKYIDNQ